MQLDPEESDKKSAVEIYGSDRPFKSKSNKFEKPGPYFHPLLGTLITGAARLMLALTERCIIDQGLDWAFCDTDSMAIANRDGLPKAEFKKRADHVVNWFQTLNPYGESKSILQREKVNFPPGRKALDPPFCLAVSAKRYVLFNKIEGGCAVRKASGHGLGHLMSPYGDPSEERQKQIERVGVPRWQEDVWKRIIAAGEGETPNEVDISGMENFDAPAVSQYAATTPKLLRWFDGYNKRHPKARVFPFGFLLSLQAKSRMQMATDDPEALHNELWTGRLPGPAAPCFKTAREAQNHAFDRELRMPIPASWLKSYGRSLVRYHMHEESKFAGAEYDQRGVLRRRHVFAIGFASIGKESENVEENELIGELPELIEHEMESSNLQRLWQFITNIRAQYGLSDREIAEEANVSHHTMRAVLVGGAVAPAILKRIARAVEALRKERVSVNSDVALQQSQLKTLSDTLTRRVLAERLDISVGYLSRLVNGTRPITPELGDKIRFIVSAGIGNR